MAGEFDLQSAFREDVTVKRTFNYLQKYTSGGTHIGEDYVPVDKTVEENWDLYCVQNNIVIQLLEVDNSHTETDHSGSYGNTVVYQFSQADGPNGEINTYKIRYAHLKYVSDRLVRAFSMGGTIDIGEERLFVGVAGETGNAYGRHLHVELHVNGDRKKPSDYILFRTPKTVTSASNMGKTGKTPSNPYPYWTFADCEESNALFITENRTFVHIVKQEDVTTDNLTDYYVITSTFNPKYLTTRVKEITERCLKNLLDRKEESERHE